jgi:hypothetical protein
MEIFDIVYDFIQGVVSVPVWVCLRQVLQIKCLLIQGDVALFAWNNVGGINSHQSHASFEKLRKLALSLLMPAENYSLILLSNSYEILNEINILEDGVLFSSEHEPDKIIFLM